MTTTKLDLTGLKCPLPALKTRKALKSVQPGDLLEVHCTDPLSVIDIPNLIRETGDKVEITERSERRIVFLIEKAQLDTPGTWLDRQTRTSAGAGKGTAFRPRRGSLRRHPADDVDQPEAARGNPRRDAGAARLALRRLHARGRAHAGLGAAHRRRRARHARRKSIRSRTACRAKSGLRRFRPCWAWWHR